MQTTKSPLVPITTYISCGPIFLRYIHKLRPVFLSCLSIPSTENPNNDSYQKMKCKWFQCFAKLIVKSLIDTEIDIFNEYNHEPLPENILTRQKIRNNLKRKAVYDMFVRPSKILHSELKYDDIKSITSGDVLLIKRNIHNVRYSKLSKLPTSLTQIHKTLKNMEFKTIKDEDFLLVNNNKTNILGFSTVRNVQALCSLNTIFIDGTYKSCPKLFYQLFTIHGVLNNNYIPLVYFLLPSKKNDIQFNPVRMYVDFEKAIHTAANVVWPSIQIPPRTKLAQKDSTVGTSFLKSTRFENCFTEDIMTIQLQDARVLEFIDYILDSYIKNDADFPPEIWSEYLSSTLRTTNNCKSFHRKLNRSFNSSHPNIYNFIDDLKNIQIYTYIALRSQGSRNRLTIENEGYIKKKKWKN
ncbi:Uncharacterized protein FWK35_00015087 [Aphis craccivora]|uniref:MULE domain-containing protein n=1 Tax=Aphis craccivora TaxID=307492 RepID=A0A6G0YJ82_APHCR|nr:Uncharacterized protein FWK35_00015087 [Aphis craccivora]